MQRHKFYSLLQGLGEFHCTKDLRRFNYRAKKNPHMVMDLYLRNFGNCKNGYYHHCEFELTKPTISHIAYFYKLTERDGHMIRLRGGQPLRTAGRGRPKSKKK